MKSADRAVLAFLIWGGAALERGTWYRQKKIAAAVGLSVSTVQRALYRMEKEKIVRIQHRQSTTNLYFVDESARNYLKFDVTPRQNDISFYRTELKTPEKEQLRRRPKSSSERKPRRAPESADDIGYREQFTEALRSMDFADATALYRRRMVDAARLSGLAADVAAQVYKSLEWRRIGRQSVAYVVAVFRDELEIAAHRLRESESRRNVSLKIAQPVQKSAVQEFSAEDWAKAEEIMRQIMAFDSVVVATVQREEEACPVSAISDAAPALGSSATRTKPLPSRISPAYGGAQPTRVRLMPIAAVFARAGTSDIRGGPVSANAARHGPGKAQWGAPTSKEFLEVAEARAG